MVAFYDELFAADGSIRPAQALRKAQLRMAHGEIVDSFGETFEHPLNWAGWTVTGAQ
jgi:CHAT domain-containing protein